MKNTPRLITLWAFVVMPPTLSLAQAPHANILPAPTGSFGIGRVSYDWRDSSRAEFLDEHAPARREIMVDIWYPRARVSGDTGAAYLPHVAELRRLLGDSVMRRRFAPMYPVMESGRLRSHAREGSSPQCPRQGCPVLIFSHGGGVDRSSYTTQYEDLASHGYVVAAIAHTYDTHFVMFDDGRGVRYAPQPRDTTPLDLSLPAWRQGQAREARSQAYVRRVIAVETADMRFVLDRLSRLTNDRALGSPFLGQLDLARVGALGHSAGGEAAAFACQLDARFKACLNQDGAMHGLPFSRDVSGRTMTQPFMFFTRELPRPVDPDTVLAAMQITRRELDSLIDDVAAGPVRLLSTVPGGAYRVLLTLPGAQHMSFSDEPLLQAVDDSAKATVARRLLAAVTTYTRAFFDKTLRGDTTTFLDRAAPDATVRVERYPLRP